jgi:hypothetical protein
MGHRLWTITNRNPKPYHFIIMHLIYSALRSTDNPSEKKCEIQLRYQAYLSACDKRKNHIKEIRRYFPDWMPPFR